MINKVWRRNEKPESKDDIHNTHFPSLLYSEYSVYFGAQHFPKVIHQGHLWGLHTGARRAVKTLPKVMQITGLKLRMNEGSVLLSPTGTSGAVSWCLCWGGVWYNGYFVCLCAVGQLYQPRKEIQLSSCLCCQICGGMVSQHVRYRVVACASCASFTLSTYLNKLICLIKLILPFIKTLSVI